MGVAFLGQRVRMPLTRVVGVGHIVGIRKMATPQVSVVLPAYNSSHVLGRAIDSVIAQTVPTWELLVVDDGSTDDTATVLAQYRQELGDRLIVIRQRNGGAGTARNAGIDASSGEFIAFLDADDVFCRHKLERQMQLFHLRPDVGLVYSDCACVDLNGGFASSVFGVNNPVARDVASTEVAPGLHVCEADFFDRMCSRYIISTITGMVRRSVLGDDIRFIPGQMYSEEWLFFLEVARRCRCGFVNEPLSRQYHLPGSLSRTCVIRNNEHQVNAMERILRRYPDISNDSRKSLELQLLHCHRQLGFDYARLGNHDRSRFHFRRAFKYKTDLRGFKWLAGSFMQSVVRRSDRAVQTR